MNGDDYESQLLTSTTTNSLSSPLSPQPESIGCEESSFLAEAMVVPNTRRNSKFRHKTVGFAERSDSGDPEKAGCLPANGQLKVHRLSLHGKPINIKQHKQDARLRRLQVQIYNFLERPRGWKAGIYHTLV